MKELDFEFKGQELTKEQMKNISGGYVSGCGVTGFGVFQGYLPCYSDACTCQDEMDITCAGSDNCDDIDCGCK